MITALLVGLGTLAVICTTMVVRSRPVRVRHYLPRQWQPEDVQ